MDSGLELSPYYRNKLERTNPDRLSDFLTQAVSRIEGRDLQNTVRTIFTQGGFLYEASEFWRGSKPEVYGLVCAFDSDGTRYSVTLSNEKNPIVLLDVKEPDNTTIAHLTLTPALQLRPDLWNRWEQTSRPMTSEQKKELVTKFTHAHGDPKATRSETVSTLWRITRGDLRGNYPVQIGTFMALGKGWGDFVDAHHNVLHPFPAPQDVVYGCHPPKQQEDLLLKNTNVEKRRRDKVLESIALRDESFCRMVYCLEGITGHQIIDLDTMDFRMLPTKRGEKLHTRLMEAIKIVAMGLSDEDVEAIFSPIADEDVTWHFVDSHLEEGIREGFFKPLDYVSPQEESHSRDEIDREFHQRHNSARKFRFLAQVLAQQTKYGLRWQFLRKNSAAINELAQLECTSYEAVRNTYRV